MKIGVCVPSMDMIHADFMSHLFALFSFERENQTIYINTRTSLVQQARYILVQTAQQAECDKMLFIDSDHIFPPDALTRLIRHGKPIIGCTYPRRREPFGLLGYRADGYEITPADHGLERVHLLPLGFMLIDMEVFDKVEIPWFCVGYDLTRDLWTSEDYGFCTGARHHGYEIWCDFELSREIGHIGQAIYSWGQLEQRESMISLPT